MFAVNSSLKRQYDLLEGEISQLYVERTHVDYLRDLQQRRRMASSVVSVHATTGETWTYDSWRASTDEGDLVDGFTMKVAGKTVSGSFWKSTFKNGDHVKIVGWEHAKIFEAVAVTKPEDRIIWMRPHCERGTKSQRRTLLKWSVWSILFTYLVAFLVTVFTRFPAWFTLPSASLAILVVLFCTIGMSWRDFMTFAREMDAVGKTLGLPNPENIDLFKSTKAARDSGQPDLPLGVYYY